MDGRFEKAFKEIYIILNRASKEEINKIPQSFVKFIKENMDIEYEPQIEFNENFEKTVQEETLLLLALIYRDYLISVEERNKLIQEEQKQLEKLEESYRVENVFNKIKKKKMEKSKNITQQLTIIKEEKWYKKVLNKILKLFNIKCKSN